MHKFSSLLNITLHVSDGLSVHHVRWLHASMQSTNMMLYVQSWTSDDGRKDHPKHVEWYSINSKICASSWFYYRNMSRCTVPWTSDLLLCCRRQWLWLPLTSLIKVSFTLFSAICPEMKLHDQNKITVNLANRS